MKRIKIAQVITRLDWAGSPDIVRIICQSLNPDKYDVTLITGPTKHFSFATINFLKEFKGKVITVSSLRRNVNLFLDLAAFCSLCSIFKKENFDIVHTHTAKAGALGRLAAYFSGIRHVVHMPHGSNFYGYFNFFASKSIVLIERLLAMFTYKFLALSELEKKELLEFGVSREGKIEVVPSGLEMGFKNVDIKKALEKKIKFGFKDNQRIVGMVCRLEVVKGVEYFVRAAIEVSKIDNGAGFIIVGEGSMRSKLERIVKENNLDNRVVFTGWRDDVEEIISFLDIMVQPSLNEAIGRVLLEAQGLGVPVIATKVGGIPEIVRDNETGVLVASKNIQELSSAILRLLKDDNFRLSLSENGKKWVDDKFSSKKMMEKIESVYQEMV
ncbi:MAG: glycosyltransferase family 4 protein [Candidatus Omnitrophica bacterium]|nr:glycosyltransferase family 4 protein [Candidatus Omnitrophota bacterium]